MRITEEARQRMIEAVREWLDNGFEGGGFLAFNPDGTGGAWYSDNVYGLGADTIRVHLQPADPEGAEYLVDRALERYEESSLDDRDE